jgi:hypothetical protein
MTVLFTFWDIRMHEKTFSVDLVARYFALGAYLSLIVAALGARRVFRAQSDGKKIWFDERDQFISYGAVLHAYYAACIVLILGLIFSMGELRDTTVSIPLYVLPLSLSSIALVVLFVYSISILIQYGWGGKTNE